MKVFFTSDTHFFHETVRRKCRAQYKTVSDMNEGLVERWNSVVGPEDRVWHLGDVSFGKTQETSDIIHRLNGHKCLVLGNHDNRTKTAWLKIGFEEVDDSGSVQVNIAGKWFLLSHYPYREGQILRHKERYGELYTPDEKGLRLLCGHVHSEYKTFGDNILNVGVDVWNGYPVSKGQIAEVFKLNPDL